MSPEMEKIMERLEDSTMSASLAVFDHLQTVAGNGSEYSTDEAMLCEAQNLKDAAQFVIDELLKKGVK